jgi:hypothetical protein
MSVVLLSSFVRLLGLNRAALPKTLNFGKATAHVIASLGVCESRNVGQETQDNTNATERLIDLAEDRPSRCSLSAMVRAQSGLPAE